jgi:hypothetical protein
VSSAQHTEADITKGCKRFSGCVSVRHGGFSSSGSIRRKRTVEIGNGCATEPRPQTDQGHQATPPERQMAYATDCEAHGNLAQNGQKAPFAFATTAPFTKTRQQVGPLQTSRLRIAPAGLYCEIGGDPSAPSITGLPGRPDHPSQLCAEDSHEVIGAVDYWEQARGFRLDAGSTAGSAGSS